MQDFTYNENFIKKLNGLKKRAFINKATGQASVIAVGFSKERFVYKNWLDRTREPWVPRKRKSKGSILVQSGRLKRSIREVYRGNGFVVIGTDVPYAKIHNEGGKIQETVTVKAHSRRRTTTSRVRNAETGRTRKQRNTSEGKVRSHKRRMNMTIPQRQFMGESVFLLNKIHRQTKLELEKQLRK